MWTKVRKSGGRKHGLPAHLPACRQCEAPLYNGYRNALEIVMQWPPIGGDATAVSSLHPKTGHKCMQCEIWCATCVLAYLIRTSQDTSPAPPSQFFHRSPIMWSFWTIVALLVAIAIPVAVGFASNAASGGGVDDWYRRLNKPSWTPPNWVFPVMWTTLYILMGVASWLVWKRGGFSVQAYPLGAYIFQLVLNGIWSPIFFGMHSIGAALVEIVILWLAIAVTIYLFFTVNAIAAYLLVPYIAWVTIATALNAYIWMYNGGGGSDGTEPLRSGY